MNDRIKELQRQLGYQKPEYAEPYRQTNCLQFLTDREISIYDVTEMHHVWINIDYYYDYRPSKDDTIVHGHNFNTTCSGPAFCHVYGYWPGPQYDPKFIQQFELKWKKYYSERGWRVK
jgi:hypothetical protein